LPEVPAFPIDPELWLLLFLPPLLFEGTINMDLELLKRYANWVGTLAFLGTLISVCLLAAFFHLALDFPLAVAALLGVMLSPTDPVSVLALFKEHGVARGLQTIVEGESVFNDGVAVVLYMIVLGVLHGESITVAAGVVEFVKVVAGGALVGLVLGLLTHRLYSAIDDHLIEVGLSLVLAYGSYLIAERLEVSGVIAVVVAGLIIGNYGRIFSMSPSTRLSLTHFWEVGAFLINGLLFLLIGLTVERGGLFAYAGLIVLVFSALVVVRAVVVYGILAAYGGLTHHSLPPGWLHVVNWGGLRGSIPVALALGLPVWVPRLQELQAITLGVVLLSLLIQGVTVKPLLGRLGLVRSSDEQRDFERLKGQVIAARAAVRELEKLHGRGEISDSFHARLEEHFEGIRRERTSSLSAMTVDNRAVRRREIGRVSSQVFAAERAALDEALRRGVLGEEVWRELKREVDARLVEGEEEGWQRLWQEEQVELEDVDWSAEEPRE
jgi:CPA1 family monovalent cation:H+ antiporter